MIQHMLQIQNLCVSFDNQVVVDCVSFDIPTGKTVSIVGESGSGKSVTALSILGLLPHTASVSGKIWFKDRELLKSTTHDYKSIRGREIAIIFQEPITSLNPVFTIGEQIEEVIRQHRSVSKKLARTITLKQLEEVGIPTNRYRAYPHEFSGGMLQRVMIAMALVCEPSLLIADEPTTALDATTSRQIIELLHQIKLNHSMSMLFITHNLSLVSEISDEICVMKDGLIVEKGATCSVIQNPRHEYTKHLLDCRLTFEVNQS